MISSLASSTFDDAERFRAALEARLKRFALSLHPDKTRLIEFARFAASSREKRGLGKPEPFDVVPESGEGRGIGGNRVVGEVPAHHLAQPSALLRNRSMAALAQTILDLLELGRQCPHSLHRAHLLDGQRCRDVKNEAHEFVGDGRDEAISKACAFFGVDDETALTISGYEAGAIYGLATRTVIVAIPKGAKPARIR